MNYNDPVGAMTTEGMDFNSTMNLAHELAHVQLGKKYDEQWDLTADGSEISLGQVDKSELYATHVENKIRAEQNAPLRTHYGYKKGVAYGRIIDKSGNFSLYYTASEKLMFPVNKYPFIAFNYCHEVFNYFYYRSHHIEYLHLRLR